MVVVCKRKGGIEWALDQDGFLHKDGEPISHLWSYATISDVDKDEGLSLPYRDVIIPHKKEYKGGISIWKDSSGVSCITSTGEMIELNHMDVIFLRIGTFVITDEGELKTFYPPILEKYINGSPPSTRAWDTEGWRQRAISSIEEFIDSNQAHILELSSDPEFVYTTSNLEHLINHDDIYNEIISGSDLIGTIPSGKTNDRTECKFYSISVVGQINYVVATHEEKRYLLIDAKDLKSFLELFVVD